MKNNRDYAIVNSMLIPLINIVDALIEGIETPNIKGVKMGAAEIVMDVIHLLDIDERDKQAIISICQAIQITSRNDDLKYLKKEVLRWMHNSLKY